MSLRFIFLRHELSTFSSNEFESGRKYGLTQVKVIVESIKSITMCNALEKKPSSMKYKQNKFLIAI